MGDKHSELEYKYRADHVTVPQFMQWAYSKRVETYKHSYRSKDTYYENCTSNVVRHRVSPNKNELTVKLRKSAKSTANRVEIDLGFAKDTGPKDVEAFLGNTGWESTLVITKDSHIFNVNDMFHGDNGYAQGFEYSVVLYAVKAFTPAMQPISGTEWFIEVEIEKDAELNEADALKALARLGKELEETFKLEKPLNDSLYELYSGKKYRKVKGKK